MSHGRPPRKPRWNKDVNTMHKATMRATLLTKPEIDFKIDPAKQALKALREGHATELNWKNLASAVAIALSIEHKRVVRGLLGHFTTADLALEKIAKRCRTTGTWVPTALYFDELDAVTTAVELHEFQLKQLSAQEFSQAYNHAIGEIVRTKGELFNDARDMQRKMHQLMQGELA